MIEISVAWRRVVQVKPFESEEYQLGLKDVLDLPPIETRIAKPQTIAARGAHIAEIEAELFRQLATMGDALIAERLKTRKA